MPIPVRLAVCLLSVTLLHTGCNDAVAPTMEELVGIYKATTFTMEEGGTTTDQLAAGASISLALNADGSTAGRLLIPGGNTDGSDFDADLTGTWLLSGRTLTLDHTADTFMRDTPFTANGMQLNGEATFGGVTIHVVLSKELARLRRSRSPGA